MQRLVPLLLLALVSPMQAPARSVSLDGTWQACRTKTEAQPGPDAKWDPVDVPARQPLRYEIPFMWYRHSFDVPAELVGQRLFLRFEGVKYVSDVWVNGERVGGRYGGFEAFECEVTAVVRQRQGNEILVRVRDVTGVIDDEMDYTARGAGVRFIDQAKDCILAPIGSNYHTFGIWQPVSLVTRNSLHVEDVWVRTSVRNKTIEATVTLRNMAPREQRADVAARVVGGMVDLGNTTVTVVAGGSVKVCLSADWPAPRLWAPDDPHLYELRTTVGESGTTTDETVTRFGFREFWIEGETMLLNGVPMKFLGTAGHPSRGQKASLKKKDAADYYRRLKETGCNVMRLHANVWPRAWFEAADEVGMPLIMESALFCYARNYAMTKQTFWDNYHEHLLELVRLHQNHPSVVMISLENEILHCGGDRYAEDCEQRLAEAGRFVKQLDPTRPIMYDGDADPEGVADVVNLHYPVKFDVENLWPNAAWWVENGKDVGGWPRTFYKWDRKKPLHMGEFLHLQHYNQPDPYTALLGDSAYLDFDEAMARCKAEAWAMQLQAYRAADVSGMCPWVLTETGEFPSDDNPRYLAVKRMYAGNGAYIREYDRRFFGGETVRRTIDLYNDLPHGSGLVLEWRLVEGTKERSKGTRGFQAKPADHFVVPIDLEMPSVERRVQMSFELSVRSGTNTVYAESHRVSVFPRRPLHLPEGVRLAVYEGENRVVSGALRKAGCVPTRVENLAELPDEGVLIVGPHALDSQQTPTNGWAIGDASSARQALARFVRGGGGVVVLEQDAYGDVVPAELNDRGCTIAFERAPGALPSVQGGDCRWWHGDHVVARKTIAKPDHGRFRTLVDSGGPHGLGHAVIVECLDGRGRMVLSQSAIGEKLYSEPIALRILEDLISRAARPVVPAALGVVQRDSRISDILNEVDARCTDLSQDLPRVDLSPFKTLLVDADCAQVVAAQVKLRAFAESGGSLVLHGATAEGLARLTKLLPEPVTAQQSSAAPVTIAQQDPVIAGLSNQELHWYGPREDMHWRQRTPLSPTVCSNALIVGMPTPSDCQAIEAESMELIDGSGRATDSEVYMHAYGVLETTVTIPASGEYGLLVRGRGTPLEGIYPLIRVTVDGQPSGVLSIEKDDWVLGLTTIFIASGRKRIGLTFANDKWDPETREDRNLRLDKFFIGPLRPTSARRLLKPAALMVMPLGEGQVIFDQVNWHSETLNETKARRYLSMLLTNLDVDFASPATGVTIPGARLVADEGVKLYRSQQGVASLAANGRTTFELTVSRAGPYELAINACGTPAGGEFPRMRVDVGGKAVDELQLNRAGWCTLRQRLELSEGTCGIGIAFINDFYDPPEDRNLRIRSVTLRPVDE